MADISKVQLPGSTEQYNIKDATARSNYETLKNRVDNHGQEIDKLNDSNIRTDEHIKSIEKTFSVLSKIMISVVAAIVLLIIKGALKI